MGSHTGKKPLIILAVIFTVIVLSILWNMNKVGDYVGSLRIPRAFLCKEIKKGVTPIPLTEKLYPNEKQVCVWFEYDRAAKGDKIKISCYRNEDAITEDSIVLTSKNGVRAFYLIKDNGKDLPVGKYRIALSTATKEWHKLTFEVIPKPSAIKKQKQDSKTKAGGANSAKNKKNSRRQQRNSGRRERR